MQIVQRPRILTAVLPLELEISEPSCPGISLAAYLAWADGKLL